MSGIQKSRVFIRVQSAHIAFLTFLGRRGKKAFQQAPPSSYLFKVGSSLAKAQQATKFQNSFNLAKLWQNEGKKKNRSYHPGQLDETRRSR